jgi:hypothetical protein
MSTNIYGGAGLNSQNNLIIENGRLTTCSSSKFPFVNKQIEIIQGYSESTILNNKLRANKNKWMN